jgi:hypothetical protein
LKTKSGKLSKEPVNQEIVELPQNIVEKEENFFVYFLFGASALLILHLFIVVMFIGVAYIFNP